MVRRITCAGVVFTMAAIAAFSQTPPQQQRPQTEDYSIRGRLVFPVPHPPDQRILIQLERTGLQVVGNAFTDSIGNFEFRNLQPGTYYLHVSVEGFEEARQMVELYSGMMRTAAVTVFLNETARVRKTDGLLPGEDHDVVDIEELGKTYPRKAVEAYEKAIRDNEKGHADSAMRRLEEAVRLAPDFYLAHNELGVQYRNRGRFSEAEREFIRARELNGRAVQPMINLGSLYLARATEAESNNKTSQADAEYVRSVGVLEDAVKANPRSAQGFYLLGSALYKTSMLEQAETSLKRSLDLDERLHAAHLMMSNVYLKLQRYEDVLTHLNAYLKNNPNGSERPAVEGMRTQVLKALGRQ